MTGSVSYRGNPDCWVVVLGAGSPGVSEVAPARGVWEKGLPPRGAVGPGGVLTQGAQGGAARGSGKAVRRDRGDTCLD